MPPDRGQPPRRVASAALVLACLCGYSARLLHERLAPPSLRLPVEPGDVALANSFSEVEMLKTALARSCATFLLDLHRSSLTSPSGTQAVPTDPNEQVDTTLRKLKQALHEFRGTEQEVQITQALLAFHSKEQNNSEWLGTYVRALYTNPTHPFVGEYAAEAVRRAQTDSHPTHVTRALNHILQIPLPLASMEQVRKALELSTGVE